MLTDGYKMNCLWCYERRDPGKKGAKSVHFSRCVSCGSVCCEKCLEYNFGPDEAWRIARIQEWECYVCNPTPQLLALQQLCRKQLDSQPTGSQIPLFASAMMNEGIELLQKILTETATATDNGLSIEGITPFEVRWNCTPL